MGGEEGRSKYLDDKKDKVISHNDKCFRGSQNIPAWICLFERVVR